jgi:hypothetical protein
VLLHILNELGLIAAVTSVMEFLNQGGLSEALVRKFNETGVGRIFIGVMQLYVDHEVIVVACLTTIRMLAEKGVGDVFNGFPVVRLIMDHWKGNVAVVGSALRFISLSPIELWGHLARADFVTPACDALGLDMTDEDFESAFYVLFQLAVTPQVLVQISAEGIADRIFEKRSDSAFMLLTKLTELPDFANAVEAQGVLPWAFEKLASTDLNIVEGALAVIAHVLGAMQEIDNDLALRAIDAIVPIVMGASKNAEIVANAFAVLTLIAENVVEKVTQLRLIRLASTLLAVHRIDVRACQNLVAFLFECARAGLVQEIQDIKVVVPTVIKTSQAFATNQALVERAVALAVMCDHPEKAQLLAAALERFPESKRLRQNTEAPGP